MLTRHTPAGDATTTYQRAVPGVIDTVTGWPSGDVEVRNFEAFVGP